MSNGELDRVYPSEIGRIKGMLRADPRRPLLAKHRRQRIGDGIERRKRGEACCSAHVFELASKIVVRQREKHEAWVFADIAHNAL